MTTTVTTRFGDLRGSAQGGIRKFLGVPFAQPPFGANRFELPKPIEPWTGARDAFEFGPTAPQSPYAGEIGKLPGTTTIPGDDILTLNIWAPEGASGLPVMVWIHGGALERGTAAIPGYDGTTFARDGVVYVSINYRIGAEGFSVLDDAPLNLGLEDAAAALRWIAAEISALGGDPKQITVFGESASSPLRGSRAPTPPGSSPAASSRAAPSMSAVGKRPAERLSHWRMRWALIRRRRILPATHPSSSSMNAPSSRQPRRCSSPTPCMPSQSTRSHCL